jgi:putative component of toxin-antitoxin plasmid stabilization module
MAASARGALLPSSTIEGLTSRKFKPIDPATLARDGAKSFDDIVGGRPPLQISSEDVALNRPVTAAIIMAVAAGDQNALSFYKKHRLFNLAGIPTWARGRLEKDAQHALERAVAAVQDKVIRSIGRAVEVHPAHTSLRSSMSSLGFGCVASYAELEQVIATASKTIKMPKVEISVRSRSINPGLYRLDSPLLLGAHALGSFVNRAEHGLVSYILSDLAEATKDLFPLSVDALKEIHERCTSYTLLVQDTTVKNILKYSAFFAKHPEIPHQRRCEFAAAYLNEWLSQLAIDVEFYDMLPQISVLPVPPDPHVTPQAASNKGLSDATGEPAESELRSTDKQQDGSVDSDQIDASRDLLYTTCSARAEFKDDQEAAIRYISRLRSLIKRGSLGYAQAYEMLLNDQRPLGELLSQLVQPHDQAQSQASAEPGQQGAMSLRFFTKQSGDHCPFKEWFGSLPEDTRRRISSRLELVESQGQLVETKPLEGYSNVFEFKFGGRRGLRVFFSYLEKGSILVWTGGHHDDQDRILRQIEKWRVGGAVSIESDKVLG